ncbi:MAG: DUF2924 domain-containing protein [Janthinobacterium lividum]
MPVSSFPSVAAQLARLDALDRDTLAVEWVSAFKVPVPRKSSREFLLKAMAHRVQVSATRDVRPAVRRALLHIGRSSRDGAVPELPPEAPILKPGARLIRAWRGETHEVTVAPDGRFAWQGVHYRSLSLIASRITGTRRNGPAFFGLRETDKTADRAVPPSRRPRTQPQPEIRP